MSARKAQIQKRRQSNNTPKRCLIVYDGKSWFVRELDSSTHDLDADQMIYRCMAPISGPWNSVNAAAQSARQWLRKPQVK